MPLIGCDIGFLWLTNCHRVSDLNNRKLFFHSSGENLENIILGDQKSKISVTGLESRCWQDWAPSRALGKNLFLTSFSLCLWLHHSIFKTSIFKSLCAPSLHCFLLCACQIYLLIIRIPVILCQATQIIQDHFPISEFLIASPKTWPSKMTFTGFRGWGPSSAYHWLLPVSPVYKPGQSQPTTLHPPQAFQWVTGNINVQ